MSAPLLLIDLPQRGLLEVSGPEASDFLQALVSQDVTKVSQSQSLWSALLTPQGKYLHDFLLIRGAEGSFLLDTEADRLPDLLKRLTRYRLRRQVVFEQRTDLCVCALLTQGQSAPVGRGERAGVTERMGEVIRLVDPRHAGLGMRVILPRAQSADFKAQQVGLVPGLQHDYDDRRLCLGVPEGAGDLLPEKSLLLENGFDELGAIDWAKGCFIGQELTARTRYRALLKKRLVPVVSRDGAPLEPRLSVTCEGEQVGTIMSVCGARALALVRLRVIQSSAKLFAGDHPLSLCLPDWMVLPEQSS